MLVAAELGVYEGTQCGNASRRTVLRRERLLTRSTPLFDTVKGNFIARPRASRYGCRSVVVVPGARAITKGKAAEWGLHSTRR